MQFVNFISRQSVFVFDMENVENVEMLMPIVISNSARRHKSCGNLRWWWRDWNESHSRYRLTSTWLSRRACERDYALKYNRIDDSKARRDVANKMRECILNLWLISSSDNFPSALLAPTIQCQSKLRHEMGKLWKQNESAQREKYFNVSFMCLFTPNDGVLLAPVESHIRYTMNEMLFTCRDVTWNRLTTGFKSTQNQLVR